MVHVRPATPADLDVIVAGNLALAEESEGLLLDRSMLGQTIVSISGR